MNIKYNFDNPQHYTFRDIHCGQVFKYEGSVYMRIAPVTTDEDTFCCVDLEEGSVWSIGDNEEVTLLNGEYVVKSSKEFKNNS